MRSVCRGLPWPHTVLYTQNRQCSAFVMPNIILCKHVITNYIVHICSNMYTLPSAPTIIQRWIRSVAIHVASNLCVHWKVNSILHWLNIHNVFLNRCIHDWVATEIIHTSENACKENTPFSFRLNALRLPFIDWIVVIGQKQPQWSAKLHSCTLHSHVIPSTARFTCVQWWQVVINNIVFSPVSPDFMNAC